MNQPKPFTFPMGVRVRDVVTGVEGRVTGRSQWLTGCNTIGINLGLDKDGKPQDTFWFDENRCEVVDSTPITLPGDTTSDPGGPQDTPRQAKG